VKGTVKETTYANYSYITWRHIAPALGRVKLKSLTPAHVRSFYGEKARTNLSAATVKKMHVVLRRALSQSVSDGLIPRNAADGVKPPRVNAPGAEIRPLNSDECRTFLEASRGERLEAVYVLAVHCGLREGELLALRWEDVDLEAAKPALHVRHTLTRGEDGRGHVIGASTKSGKGRRVRLTRRAVAALKDHRKGQLEERMRLAGLWHDEDLVFPSETGSLLNPSNLRNRSFKRIKERAGVREDLRFHDLRHTCATLLLREGVNVKVVSEMLGRASVIITLNTYSHVLPDMQDSAAEAMEAALGIVV
jgi:integrase